MDLKQNTLLTAFYFGLYIKRGMIFENACALWAAETEIERYSEKIYLTCYFVNKVKMRTLICMANWGGGYPLKNLGKSRVKKNTYSSSVDKLKWELFVLISNSTHPEISCLQVIRYNSKATAKVRNKL